MEAIVATLVAKVLDCGDSVRPPLLALLCDLLRARLDTRDALLATVTEQLDILEDLMVRSFG